MDGRQASSDAGAVPALLTVAEVAVMLRVSTMTVYRLLGSGELPGLRVGRSYRIRATELDAYLASGTVVADESNG
ncbi:helix-turn-helix domain-containing protein [Nitriliruptoraceae bacterium ZYF776]|nr:helix-turn-helix domain-containing protein [Profundirhabdus halotolerans]